MIYPLLITFKPVDTFYFGSLNTFGEGFFAESQMFPSQQTILGCLRKTILQKHNLLDANNQYPDTNNPVKEKQIHKLTGTGQMKCLLDEDDDFGIIKKISPVFLARKRKEDKCFFDFLLPVPFDVIYKKEVVKDKNKKITGLELIEFNPLNNTKKENDAGLEKEESPNTAPHLKKTKEDKADYLGGIEFWEAYKNYKHDSGELINYHSGYKEDSIFIEQKQIGIARKDRHTVDEAFYNKKAYKLADEFMFAVIVFVSEAELTPGYVFLGGERSCFYMDVIELPACNNTDEINNNYTRIFNDHPVIKRFLIHDDWGDNNLTAEELENSKLILISPYISSGKLCNVYYAQIPYSEYVRMMQFNGLKTDTYTMIPAGSIVHPFKNFKYECPYKIPPKIGYNFFIKF